MMNKKTKNKKNNNKKIIEVIFSIIIIILIAFLSQNELGKENTDENKIILNQTEIKSDNIITDSNSTNFINLNSTGSNTNVSNTNSSNTNSKNTKIDGYKTIVVGEGNLDSLNNLNVYYIDVGQADSILITNEGHSALIDAGNNEDGNDVVNFIKNKGITKLDYVIGTHPHEDHIGGMDDVINNFDIDKIYLPKIQTNTKTYEDVMKAISNKKMKINSFKKGDKFNIGEAEVEVMTDSILDNSNLNLSSNILKMTFNGTSFLFTGDAEKENEESIDNWQKVDFLKVGHHGSNTSTSQSFLDKIQPKYAIISVGKDNDYGHPHQKILKRLQKIGATILRTDESGTIQVIVTK